MTDAGGMIERLSGAGLPPLPRTAWLEIDLDALASNLEAIRSALPPGLRVEPVVKADAYGHGATAVAAALVEAGADGLCVATLDEALELRAAGIGVPILVLFPIPPALASDAATADLTVAVGDRVLLERMIAALAAHADGPRLRLAVEVETGLGRGGIPPEDVPAVIGRIEQAAEVELASVWSHLTAADDEVRTADQVARFTTATEGWTAAGGARVGRHIAASGGILVATAPAYEAVRPGLAIYGLVPEEIAFGSLGPGARIGVRPVMSLHCLPVRVLDVPTGSGVGYGPAFTTDRPSRIATLPVGYGDGFARTMSGRVEALVRGVRVPIVGTIAMDAAMADVTDVPGEPVTIDDEFVLLGSQEGATIDAYELARARTTVSWEVVAAMAARLPRVYTRASFPVGVRTLIAGRAPWRTSNSGTGTSVTSRSMPS